MRTGRVHLCMRQGLSYHLREDSAFSFSILFFLLFGLVSFILLHYDKVLIKFCGGKMVAQLVHSFGIVTAHPKPPVAAVMKTGYGFMLCLLLSKGFYNLFSIHKQLRVQDIATRSVD